MRVRDAVITALRALLRRARLRVRRLADLHAERVRGDVDAVRGATYFDEKAYLTQSGQLYAEAAAMALGKVYCFGPTFRAEKSKTRRHLTEFWMLEPEVAYATLDDIMAARRGHAVVYVVREVLERRRPELVALERDLSKLEAIVAPFPRLTYDEAATILAADPDSTFKYGDDFGAPDETILSNRLRPPGDGAPLSGRGEGLLHEARSRRPDEGLCVDVLGTEGVGELIGGSQREDDLELLLARIEEHELPEEAFEWYLDLRRYGSVPHAGFGLGLERTVAWIAASSTCARRSRSRARSTAKHSVLVGLATSDSQEENGGDVEDGDCGGFFLFLCLAPRPRASAVLFPSNREMGARVGARDAVAVEGSAVSKKGDPHPISAVSAVHQQTAGAVRTASAPRMRSGPAGPRAPGGARAKACERFRLARLRARKRRRGGTCRARRRGSLSSLRSAAFGPRHRLAGFEFMESIGAGERSDAEHTAAGEAASRIACRAEARGRASTRTSSRRGWRRLAQEPPACSAAPHSRSARARAAAATTSAASAWRRGVRSRCWRRASKAAGARGSSLLPRRIAARKAVGSKRWSAADRTSRSVGASSRPPAG